MTVTHPKPDEYRPDDTEIQKNPYPFYEVLREQRPVLASDFAGRPCWVVSRREDVRRVLMDPATFPSVMPPKISLLTEDSPPEHERLRKMVAHLFTRQAVLEQEGRIAERADALARDCVAAGTFDVVTGFGGPLTVSVISMMLGIAAPEVESLRDYTKLGAEAVRLQRLGIIPSEKIASGRLRMRELLMGLIQTDSYEKTGALAALAERLHAGELTDEECMQFAVLLLVAGHSTTTNLISNAIFVLTERPADLDRLRDEEGFASKFVEEVLRTRPSFQRNLRLAARDVELHGEHIPAGALVSVLLGSANRDPAAISDPDSFNPDREGDAHVSFGQGIHTCLGMWLARLEAGQALQAFARHAASVSLVESDRPTPLSGGTFNEFGFEALPVAVRSRTDRPL